MSQNTSSATAYCWSAFTRYATIYAHEDGTFSADTGGHGPGNRSITSDLFRSKTYAEAVDFVAQSLRKMDASAPRD